MNHVRLYVAALCGYLFHVGAMMFHQDMLGLERYIQHVQANWINLSPVWGAVIMLVAFLMLRTEIKQAKKEIDDNEPS